MNDINNLNHKITILHVFHDDKFFDIVADFFMQIPIVNNLFCYYSSEKKAFKYIKRTDLITLYREWNDYKYLLSDKNVDIIYFHSLPTSKYEYFKYIDPNKIVIWWCWGYDIYNNDYGLLKAFIELDIVKPLTKGQFYTKTNTLKHIYHSIKSIFLYSKRKKVLKRIDYFSPVIPLEYQLMKKNKHFNAKPFMLESGPGLFKQEEFAYREIPQNIIIGNSLTITNNHLDIFKRIQNIYLSKNRNYIVPVNYGNGIDLNIIKASTECINAKFKWLESFLNIHEYKIMFQSVTHAIFGHIRQQALGNIHLCLINGIKIYLYKDSMIYSHLKARGFYVYTIDNDLSELSLNQNLSKEEALHNYQLFYRFENNKLEKTILEIENIIK